MSFFDDLEKLIECKKEIENKLIGSYTVERKESNEIEKCSKKENKIDLLCTFVERNSYEGVNVEIIKQNSTFIDRISKQTNKYESSYNQIKVKIENQPQNEITSLEILNNSDIEEESSEDLKNIEFIFENDKKYIKKLVENCLY